MADPRVLDFTGIDNDDVATFKIDDSTITFDAAQVNGSAAVGKAVTLSADKTVALAADGEAVIGKLLKVEPDKLASVQYAGYMTLPAGTGASLTLGKKIVGAVLVAAKGYIRETNTATAAENGVSRGFIVDNDTTTAVLVKL